MDKMLGNSQSLFALILITQRIHPIADGVETCAREPELSV
jgi:hypothetical protein